MADWHTPEEWAAALDRAGADQKAGRRPPLEN